MSGSFVRSRPRVPHSTRNVSTRNLAGILMILLPCLLLSACDFNSIFGGSPAPGLRSGPTATPTLAASTIIPGPQLTWKPATLPAGTYKASASGVSFAPSNGDVAYACALPTLGSSAGRVLVTHDRASTWARAVDLPTGKADATFCSVTAGITDPATAVAIFAWPGSPQAIDPAMPQVGFITFDFWAHWRSFDTKAFASLNPEVASTSGHLYGLRMDPQTGAISLSASSDQGATWHTTSAGSLQAVVRFWLDATTGALLVLGPADISGDELFFASTDGGAHWAKVPTPLLDPSMQLVVAPPQPSQPWKICLATSAIAPNGNGQGAQPGTLECSMDSGITWTAHPTLNVVEHSSNGWDLYSATVVGAMLGDGAVIETADTNHVYRLPAFGNAWQDLGPLPAVANGSAPDFYPTASSGMLAWTSDGLYTATYQ